MTQLTQFYNYRVSNGKETRSFPNRYQAAKQIERWAKQGITGADIEAEARVNGDWRYDQSTHDLAEKHMKERPQEETTLKQPTLKTSLHELAKISKICASADELTPDHLVVLQESINVVVARLETFSYDTFDNAEEMAR